MTVSVIIPVHNSKSYVERCIGSILPQLSEDMELIAIDDASTDGSFDLLMSLYGADPRAVLVRLAENRGPAAARNAGIRISRGDFLAFCDADDEWEEGCLSTALARFESDPQTQMVFSRDRVALDDDTPRTARLAEFAQKDLIHFRNAIIRREVFEKVGLMDESMRSGEDREWLVRAKSSGTWGELLPNASVVRHIRDDGLSAAASEEDRKARTIESYIRGIRKARPQEVSAPDLSILIPAYQAEKYAREAVESCRTDKYSCEIIAVNDGSADGTAEMLRSLPVTFASRRHKGQAASRNDALKLSRGRRILYLDADDRFTEGAVDTLMAAAEEDPEALVVSAMCRDFISPELTEEEAAPLKTEPLPSRRMLAGCMLVKRETFDVTGLYDETMPSSETAAWVLKIRDAGLKIHETDDVVLERRYHKTNLGRTSRQTQMESYMALIRSRLNKK